MQRENLKIPQVTLPTKLSIDKLPLAELHVHAPGGVLTHKLLRKLIERNKEEINKALEKQKKDLSIFDQIFYTDEQEKFKFNKYDFIDFLAKYDIATIAIMKPQDVTDVIYDYLKRCAEQGAIYIELMCSPDHYRTHRISFAEVTQSVNGASLFTNEDEGLTREEYEEYVQAIAKAINRARKDFGIEARTKMVLLRHNGAKKCMHTLQRIVESPHPYVVGIDLAGDEAKNPPELFEKVYAYAKQHGLRLSAHAGEHEGAKYIWKAIKTLQLERIGHGIRCLEDPDLVAYLKTNEICLEVSPGSNVEFLHDKYPSRAAHPFKKLLDSEVPVTLNSDDPNWIGTDILQEYKEAKAEWKLTKGQLIKITRNAINYSFAEDSLKEKCLAQIDVYEAFKNLNKLFNAVVKTEENKKAFKQVLVSYKTAPSIVRAQEIVNSAELFRRQYPQFLQAANVLLKKHQHFDKCATKHQHILEERLTIKEADVAVQSVGTFKV